MLSLYIIQYLLYILCLCGNVCIQYMCACMLSYVHGMCVCMHVSVYVYHVCACACKQCSVPQNLGCMHKCLSIAYA